MSRSTAFGKALAAGFIAAVVAPAALSIGFVERTGADFILDGSRWRFVGHNNYQLTSDRRENKCGRVLSDRTVKKLLRQAKRAGAIVVRTWFFQSYYVPEDDNPWEPFDRVLREATRMGLKVIPVLVNHFPDCEPSRGRSKNERFYEFRFRKRGWGYPKSYKAWARMVARHYRSDPTIAFWQLVNEAETSSGAICNRMPDPERFGNNVGRSANILRAFADEMTRTLKRVDPNHLVSLGTIGSGQCGAQEHEYQFVHAGSVDMCEYHDYGDVTQAIPDDGFNRLRQRIHQCNALGKPLVVGEAGIVADIGDDDQSTGSITNETLGRRAALFNAKLSAAFAQGIDGYLVWEKIPDASTSSYNLTHGRFGVGPSDPLNAVTKQHPDIQGAARLTVIKDVKNDNGGNANPDDFQLIVNDGGVLSGTMNTFPSNTPLAINEMLLSGYDFVNITGDAKCPAALGGTVTLTEGEHVTCTIHNNDQAASLTVIKDVKNDNGGNANPDDFQLIVNDGGVLSGATNIFPSNTPLAINETLLSGYNFVNITGDSKCPAALGGTVTLKEGEHVTCIIHNDDQSESVVLLNPADSTCSGLAVDFQWKIENQRPSRIYCSIVITDKGSNPFDGSFEDIFDAGQSTSFLVSLDPFFYDPADFQWGVRVTACNGLNDTCPCTGDVLESAVRNLKTTSQPSNCN